MEASPGRLRDLASRLEGNKNTLLLLLASIRFVYLQRKPGVRAYLLTFVLLQRRARAMCRRRESQEATSANLYTSPKLYCHREFKPTFFTRKELDHGGQRVQEGEKAKVLSGLGAGVVTCVAVTCLTN